MLSYFQEEFDAAVRHVSANNKSLIFTDVKSFLLDLLNQLGESNNYFISSGGFTIIKEDANFCRITVTPYFTKYDMKISNEY